MSNVPSEEEFARASRLMEQDLMGLDKVKEAVISYFKKLSPLHDFYLLPQYGGADFHAYVFFEKEMDIVECKKSGTDQRIIDFVYEKLEVTGIGEKSQITVEFEFDSNENVIANFEGNYSLRLR